MTVLELIEKRKAKFEEMTNIVTVGQTEQRKLSAVETTAFENIKKEVEELDKEIDERQSKDNNKKINNINIINKNMENSILLKTIRDAAEGRPFDERSVELLDEGRKTFSKSGISYKGQIILPTKFESRANILAGTGTNGQEIVAEDKFGLIGKLYASSVVFAAGAQLMTGLSGDISIPVYGGTGSGWATEVGAKVESGGTFSEVTLAPKRLTTILLVSRQFLAQDSVSAEEVLINDMRNSIMATLESSILDATAAGTSRPAGILNGVSYTSTGTTSWAKIVALESAVETNNALMGGLGYIATPTLKGTFKTTAKDSGSGIFIASEGNVVNGYPMFSTSNMASGKVAFGNWNDLLVGNWGGMDVLVNPYTYAKTGQVELVINTYWSWAKRRSASFAFASLT